MILLGIREFEINVLLNDESYFQQKITTSFEYLFMSVPFQKQMLQR